ncbi:hypothetical protein DB347_18885 [Opitutaceae bacterium EW11]|nr:hypothetical protein DB347_18885 [Opitutaceae bacterium EW11]
MGARHGAWTVAGLLILAVVFQAELLFADEPVPVDNSKAGYSTENEVIRSVEQYWNLDDELKKVPHSAELELVVYYYDPVWGLLWGEEEGGRPAFMNVKMKPLPIRSRGQRIRIRGEGAITAIGIDGRAAQVTVVDENAKISAIEANAILFSWKRLNSHMVALSGFVDRQEQLTPNHLALSLIVEGKKVLGRVWIDDNRAVPQYEGSFISIEGVFLQNADSAGQLKQIELWNAGPDYIQTHGSLLTDPRFALPISAIDSLGSASPNEYVHLVGKVVEQRAGFSIVLRDDTGQATLDAVQTDSLNPGETIEVIGTPEVKGITTTIFRTLYRRPPKSILVSNSGLGSALPGRLRLADQVRSLSLDKARLEIPARITGVVTWVAPDGSLFFLQDSSGGVRVDCSGQKPSIEIHQGIFAEVTGVSATDGSTRLIRSSHLSSGSDIALPPARPVTLDQALAGVGESQWVEMSGYLRQVGRKGKTLHLDLTTPTGEFSAVLPDDPAADAYLNSVVHLKGVVGAVFDERGRVSGIQLRMSSLKDLRVEEPFPQDPFSVPQFSISEIGQFGFFQERNRWVRTAGVVTMHLPGRYLSLQDGTNALRVLSRQTLPLSPGDRVEVVGLPGREGGRTVLREAVYRRTQLEVSLKPETLPSGKALQPHLDGRVVQVHGTIIDVSLRAERPRITLQSEDAIIECVAEGFSPNTPAAREWELWAQATATGVYRLEQDEYGQPFSFNVQLRTPEDILITKPRPWWTAKRALAAVGVLTVCSIVGVVGVLLLRRRVRQQTELIRRQMEKEARMEAELERSSRLESLGVLAGGIAHDFNNLLTVVVGNITLSLSDNAVAEAVGELLRDAVRGAMRARDLTQQLLTFAKGGDPIRGAVSLEEVVREAAKFALHGSQLAAEFVTAPDIWPANVDKGQIGQVVHNLVLNASQAMPNGGSLRFFLENDEVKKDDSMLKPGRYLKLTVSDNGPGIAPEHLRRIFDPYFSTKPQNSGLGLATVRSIVKKHGGHIEVESALDRGTTFRIWLPAADSPVLVSSTEPFPAPALPAPEFARHYRVLFMDDDEAIRRVAATLLRRLGYRHTLVEEGQRLLDAYETALDENDPYDVVIMDLTIPGGMGGKDAMRELLKRHPEVKAIVSSGYSSDPVLANYRAYGFKAMVPKPYNVNDLARTLKMLVEDTYTEEKPDGSLAPAENNEQR